MTLEWASLRPQWLQMAMGWIRPCLLWQDNASGTPRQHAFTSDSAYTVWEWGKCSPPSIASEVPGVAKSEVLQEVGDRGSFGMDGPPSPAAQDDFGMDLALPTEAREHVRIPSEAHTQEVETQDSFGMDAPPSPMAQDTFGMDSPISPRDGLPDEGIGADLALPTEAGEHCIRIPSAACTINWGGHALSPIDSQIQEGQVGESSEALQEVQVQHPPELVLEEEVWYVYEQEKEMSKVIDEMIDELDNAEVQNLV
ncbi:hypothetical protein EDB85DRAFT_1890609 [Lactarius pseudohatsudake]|nr:hypothetical protein EDB85DRAFT_1900329 [Lactarius pseudohatsudake]KAH9032699.1 hypothetical protein EDB85DRAFT_1890609 [Lactarius pseudohatsudake]